MTRKRFSEEDILGILRQIELELASGGTVETAIRSAGISDETAASTKMARLRSRRWKRLGRTWKRPICQRPTSSRINDNPIRPRESVLHRNSESASNAMDGCELQNANVRSWLKQYNHIRPHQSLNMRPPVTETLLQTGT